MSRRAETWQLGCRLFVTAWFVIGGTFHFLRPAPFVAIVPPWIPWPLAAVYLSGLAELAGAALLWPRSWRRLVGFGLIVLTICVTPANIYMWQHAAEYPNIPAWALLLRLPLQLVLIGIIWYGTWPRRE